MAKEGVRDAPYLPSYEKISWQRPATVPVIVVGVIANLLLAVFLVFLGIELGPFNFKDLSFGAVFPWILLYATIQFGWWGLKITHTEEPWWKEKMPSSWVERRKKFDFERYISMTYPRVIPLRIYRIVARMNGDELSVSPRFYSSSDSSDGPSPELMLLTRKEEESEEIHLYGYFEGESPRPFTRGNFPEFDWPFR